METQKQTLTRLLNTNPWVCGTVFQSAFIPEYRSLINKIRKDGTPIEARKCRQHNHRGGRLQDWSISSKTPQGGTETLLTACCVSQRIFGICEAKCPSKDIKKDTIAGVLF